MKKAFDFFESFDGQAILISDLSLSINEPVESLSSFFGNYKNYKANEKFYKKFSVENEYYIGDTLCEDSFAHLNQKATPKAVKILNKYFLSEHRKADLFICKNLLGSDFEMGQTDTSDIGGLYHSAWVVKDTEDEVPFFTTKESPEFLLNLIENLYVSIELKNGIYHTKFTSLNLEAKHTSLNLSIAECFKQLSSTTQLYSIQSFWESDEGDLVSYSFGVPKVFLTQNDAEKYMSQNQEPGLVYKLKNLCQFS